ncbi:MAG: phosphoenolpyruvate carboxykinase [Candidatus Omnitrophica bacterium]|nr:phosphoenolpyruvate carboxykinase [Candidatus Omnitrophota bacterium]
MNFGEFEILENKVIIRIKDRICENAEELLNSALFLQVLNHCLKNLQRHNSYLLGVFAKQDITDQNIEMLIKTLNFLAKMTGDLVPNVEKGSEIFFRDKALFNEFVDYLYNYWRSFDRFIICESEENNQEKRPYRIFNNTIEQLTHLVRAVYRDIQENITGTHPRIYRQVRAGAEIASIAVPKIIPYAAAEYEKLNSISFIRQILIYPPLILNQKMNKRTGTFERIKENPLKKVILNQKEWLCYPAKVGELIILIYVHQKFYELGYSLCNLFELADDADLNRKPDAVYCYGVDKKDIQGLGKSLTVFYEDQDNDMMVAAVPNDDEFGYFGYLKKMVLTLYNVIMIRRGVLPFHGALLKIMMPNNKKATMLLMGDTGAGKSETIEAMRDLGKNEIQDMIIIADDMGSIKIDANKDVIGYGTEIGAFLRLDDLKAGYAFGQIDRAIIMSPNKINARIILPVTTFERLISGHKIDFILYANNYEEIDEDHPIVEQIDTAEKALQIFREGTVMSKGTTTSTGLVHSYFANVFGPYQYKEAHDKLAKEYFKAFFGKDIFIGQMRTRLGISGYERKGPEEAARELLEIMKKR